MSMNAERHTKSFVDLFQHRIAGDIEKADAIRDFYKEYFAIMDMSADFYLETVEQVFQRYLLPQGQMKHKGAPIEPRAIKKTFLLTVEGEKDDICAVGQTLAAQDLCSGLQALHEDPPSAGRRRPLRRLQRQALGERRSIRCCATTSSRADKARPRADNEIQADRNKNQIHRNKIQADRNKIQARRNENQIHFPDANRYFSMT